MAIQSETRRSLLFAFITSIALCGLIGMYCLLVGQFSSLAGRVMGTTASVGAASVLGLAAAVPWERRRWWPIGPLAMVAVGTALVLLLSAIWIPRAARYEGLMKSMVIAIVAAVALPHAGLLGMARLRRSYGWVRRWTVITIAVLALQIIVMVLFEWEDDLLFRLLGSLAILDVCGTITVPVLHRLSAIREHVSIATPVLDVELTCPRCATGQRVVVGRSRCASCGLGLRVEVDEEQCEQCGYLLYKIDSSRCPECGATIARGADGDGGA